MAELILLQVDPGLAREVEQTAARQDAGLNVARADQSREVMDHVEQTPSDVAAVVVGANVSQPTRLAQQIHHIDRQISIVVLTSSAGWQELNQALLFTPLLGQDVQCLAEGHEAVVEAVLEAAGRRQRRQSYARATASLTPRIAEAGGPPRVAAHFEHVLDQAPVGVVTVDDQGRVEGWNRHAGQLLNVGEREALNQPLWLQFPPFERERVQHYLEQVLAGQAGAAEHTFDRSSLRAQGQFLGLAAVHTELRADQFGAVVLIRDVTAREEARRQRDELEQSLRQQRRWFEATVLSIGDGVIATDEAGRVTLMNRVAERLTGWNLEEARGRASHEVFRVAEESSGVRIPDPVGRVLRQQEGADLDSGAVLLCPDGRRIPIDDSGSPIHDRDGHVTGVVVVFRDISRRREAERALQQSEQRLRLILDNLTDYAIFTLDLNGKITTWNRGAERLVGYTEEEAVGADGRLIFTEEDRSLGEPERELQETRTTGRAADNRWHVRKDGSRFWALAQLTLLTDDEGRALGFVKILQDLTETHQWQMELEERARQQAVVAEFGQTALEGRELQPLLDKTVTQIAETLNVPLVKVLRQLPDEPYLLIQSGVGWRDGVVGHTRVDATFGSHAGYTLLTEQPVVVEDLQQETRFRGMPVLHNHGVVSGVSAIIPGPHGHTWGILTAHMRELRHFSQDDIYFLQAMANALAAAIQRNRTEHQLRTLNETLEQRVAERTEDAERRARQLQEMASELTQAEQRERRRLAELLHDHLQQLLAAGKMHIGMLTKRLEDEKLKHRAQQVQDLLGQSIEMSRTLTAELSPPVLYEGGLIAALQWLSRWMEEKHELKVHVHGPDHLDLPDEQIRVLLFQAARELLFNTAKYSGVQKAELTAEAQGEDHVVLTVRDEGAGFNPVEAKRNHGEKGGFGLFSIRERLELMGGTMEVDSAPEQGTRITLTAPRGHEGSEAVSS